MTLTVLLAAFSLSGFAKVSVLAGAKEGDGMKWREWFSLARWLDRVERVGNRLPDPITLFVILSVVVLVLSWLLSVLGVTAAHPADGQLVQVENLLSKAGLQRILGEMVYNFATFPPLGLVLVTMIGIGVTERSGLIHALLRRVALWVPGRLLTMTLVFMGVMSSMAADAGYVVLTPLGAVLFAGLGRHPIAGLTAAFAGVSGGFSANLLLTSLDPLLSGLSTSAANILDPDYVVQATANYYFMIFSTFLVTAVGTWVTSAIVEPRLGPWEGHKNQEGDEDLLQPLSNEQKKGLTAAGMVFALSLAFIALSIIPAEGLLRDESQMLAPFYKALVPLIMIVFLLMGLVYGYFTKTIRSDKDVARMTSETMATMGGYIVLAFAAAQFVAYFSWSNLGIITAISGASFLNSVGLTGTPLILGLIAVSMMINLFIGSASAKWAIMAPIFIPMMMVMGFSPELVQVTYRVGDSVTNIITPLLPYFPILIVFAQKYQPKIGIGTLISLMLPYSLALALVWSVALMVWIGLGLPLGPGAPLAYP